MGWRIEVLTKTYHIIRGDAEEWLPLKATNGAPYDWRTRREAEAMQDLFYSDVVAAIGRVRVVHYEPR
jgi:hypothetical protein